MKVFIGMECSGVMRRAFQRRGHTVISCDYKPAEDNAPPWEHIEDDVFDTICWLQVHRWQPDLAIFHPDCTYLTCSAEWAYKDPPYHQKLKPGTLFGHERRIARIDAVTDFHKCRFWPFAPRVAVENPIGIINRSMPPTQIVHPWWFGDDASKATCWWLSEGMPLLTKTNPVPPRMVAGRPRWGNQTDSGQNRLSPSPTRAADRARTYPGMAEVCAATWG